MIIRPNEPLKCTFMGIPANYQPFHGGGYEIRFKISNIPLKGYQLSRLHEKKLIEGEYTVFVESLDADDITDVEPILTLIDGG